MKGRHIRFCALLLLAVMLFSCLSPAPAAAEEEDEVFRIRTAEDFREFLRLCSYDAWSLGRTVALERDISLSGAAVLPASSFSGTFDGGGHTVSGLEITDSVSPAGLFGVLTREAVVRGLHVEGVVTPAGSGKQVGGIAGVNRGSIQSCSFSGTVTGESLTGGIVGENCAEGSLRNCQVSGGVFGRSMTGGVAGMNSGMLSACSSRAYVNTNTADPTVDLTELDLDAADALRRLSNPDTYNLITDSGGIAGFSQGSISACTNSGTVGYQHIGYNMGGVVGRSRGFVSGCRNEGAVYGRKDVGGIVGLAEPYVKLEVTESAAAALGSQMDTLNALVDRAVGDASGASAALSARLSAVSGSVDAVRSDAQALTARVKERLETAAAELVSGEDLLRASLPMLRLVTEDLLAASDSLTEAAGLLSSALTDPASQELLQALQALDAASRLLDAGLRQLRTALSAMEGSIRPAPGVTEEAWQRMLYGYTDESGGHVPGALEELRGGVGSLRSIQDTLAGAMRGLREGLDDGSIATLGDLRAYLGGSGVREALQGGPKALETIRESVWRIGENSEFTDEAARRSFASLQSALELMTLGQDGSGGVFALLGEALEALCAAGADADASAADLRACVGALQDAAEQSSAALSDLESLLDLLSAREPVQVPAADAGDDASAAVYASLEGLSGQLDLLNGEAKGASDVMLEDIRRINDQFRLVMGTMLNALDDARELSPEEMVRDASDEDIDEAREGKILRCTNLGPVAGDIDVGGVAGSMMLFNALNPEGDETVTVSAVLHRTYTLKCILQDCVNTGTVTGKRSNVASVCGDGQLGVISGCQAYGSAASEGGDYVGGVAGHGDNIIRNCWARCVLRGRRYLGGIVGSGSEEKSNLLVTQCRSMVSIPEAVQFAGAVAGTDAGSFSENVFVSDDLAGLDRISVRGQAEPVAYSALLEIPGLPYPFRSFTLRFLAEGSEVSSRSFVYGQSFDRTVFPAVPRQDGQYGVWDRQELRDLHFDTDVTALYYPLVTALSSEVTRVDSRPVFFVSGAFTDRETLPVVPAIMAFAPDRSSPWKALKAKGSTLLEQWELTVPGGGEEVHALRYLPPRAARGRLELYRAENGGWTLLETEQIGSYLCFTLPEGESTLSLVSVSIPWWGWAIAAGLALALLIFLIALFMHRKARQEQTEEEQRRNARFRRRRRLALLLTALLILLLGGTSALLLHRTGFALNQEIYLLLHSFAERRDTDMELSFTVEDGEKTHTALIPLYTEELGGKRLTCAEWQGIPIYYCDGTVLLENGRAYPIGAILPDHIRLLTGAAKLYRSLDVSVTEENDRRVFHAEADSPEAVAAVTGFLPGFVRDLPEPERIALDLLVQDGEIQRLEARWDAGGKQVSAAIQLGLRRGAHDIPLAVQTALASGARGEGEAVGEDVSRLLLAWMELSARDPLGGEAALKANCGPLLLDERLAWQRTGRYGKAVSCLDRDGTVLYFTEDAACTRNGAAFARNSGVFTQEELLLRLIYEAVLLGEVSAEDASGGRRCTVTLDGDAMDRFARVIAPEAELDRIGFAEGTASILLRDGRLAEAEVRCRGSIRVVRSEAAASVSGRLVFSEDAVFPPLPGPVLDALDLRS